MAASFQPQLLRRALLSFFLNLNFTFLDLITCFPTFSSSWLLLTQGLIRENGSNWVSSPARNRISPPRPFHCLIIIIITIKSDVLLTDFEKKEMKRSETMLTKKVKACWSEGTQLDPADYSDLQNFSNFLHPSFPAAHNFYGDKSFLSIWLDFGGFKLRIQNVFTTTVELFSKIRMNIGFQRKLEELLACTKNSFLPLQ